MEAMSGLGLVVGGHIRSGLVDSRLSRFHVLTIHDSTQL